MKKLLDKIKSLNTSQAIIVAALIISISYMVSNNFYQISEVFCGKDCSEKKLNLSKTCAKQADRRTPNNTPAKIVVDYYKKCLKTYK